MPLVRFEVRNEYGLGDPELYRGPAKREDPKALLDGVAVAGLVGILRQLGDLAEFAADVFHDLHEQVMVTAARGHKIVNRIQHIEEALPTLEKAIQGQKSHIHFAYVAGSDWHANLRMDHSHLLSSDLPRFMLDSYEECRDPPRLYLLDKFDSGGTGSCLKRYSDPSYFKHVQSASESEKSVKFPREKKYLKNKRKGSRLRNGEIQHARPMSQCSSSTCFASPSTDGQGLSTENISISQMRLNPELASGSPSSGSKTRLSFIEQVSDTNPSLVPDEIEYDKLSVSKLHINHSDSCALVPHDERNGNCADDDSQHDSLQRNVPSVTWDEKTEIVKPTSPKSCDDILVDRVLDPEPLPETSEPLNMDLETAELGALEQEDILLDIPNARLSSSGGNHFDEVTSETDNYMDALNTLESETETDSEYQTKREVKSLSNFGYQGVESGTGKMNGMDAIDSDSSDVETPLASHCSFNKDLPPEPSNLISSESSERVQSPLTTGFASNLDTSVGNDFSEDFSDTSRMKSSEGINNDLSPDSSIPNLQTMLGVETTDITSKSLDSLGMPSAKFWTNGGLLGVEPSKPPDFSVPNIASENIVSGAKNTGCEFSTYPVTSELHAHALLAKSDTVVAPNENMSRNSNYLENMDGSPNTLSSVDQSSLNSDQLFGIVYNAVPPNDPFKCSPFPHDNPHDNMSAMQTTQESVGVSSLSQFGKDPDTPDSIFAHTNRHDQREKNATPGAELPYTSHIDSQSNESGKNTRGISSSFSGLAQRFLANSLERRALHASADTQTPSGVDRVLNADITRSRENSLQNVHKEGPTEVMSQISYEQKTHEKLDWRSSRKSISSSSRYSEISSPPLEHMKISFHPMNGLEISKLKLEFPNGNLLESNEDLMFPSFQLVPGPALPLQDTGFESDDDTFCRSCPYSSEDILSPRSYSNSELWEQEERSGSKDHEIYDDSRRISSSTASNSSFMGFEQTNHCNIHLANEFENLEDKDDAVSFQNSPIIDLPGLDSVISSKHQQTGQCDPLSVDHVNSALPNELPPPPPLPPMQWRIMKSSFASGGDMDYGTAAIADHLSDLQAQRFSVVWQQEQTAPKPPCTSEPMAAHSNKKTGLKLNGNREANHEVNGNKVDEREELLHQIRNRHDLKNIIGQSEPRRHDYEEPEEREDLLHQIRNKTFNLRRTVPAKPSLVPQSTTNVKVAAILEKANAIRQACVGSDEGGDDDNWSDG